jgi:hypothetical protein
MAGLFKRPNALAAFAAPQPRQQPDPRPTILGQALRTGLAERILVRNVIGSSGFPCGCCDSWLDHYHGAVIGLPPRFCSAVGCGNVATLGGHVVMVRNQDRSWRIVPLCVSCNGLGRAYEIYGHIQLVPAKPLLNCVR